MNGRWWWVREIWIHFCVRQPDVGGSIDTLSHILNAHLNRVACPRSNYEKKLKVLLICCSKGFSSLLIFDKRINCNTHRVFCHISFSIFSRHLLTNSYKPGHGLIWI